MSLLLLFAGAKRVFVVLVSSRCDTLTVSPETPFEMVAAESPITDINADDPIFMIDGCPS